MTFMKSKQLVTLFIVFIRNNFYSDLFYQLNKINLWVLRMEIVFIN